MRCLTRRADHHQPAGLGRSPASSSNHDTGVGMDQEALSKIFEPYFSTKATGTASGSRLQNGTSS